MPQILVSFNRIAGVAVLLFTPMFADTFGYRGLDDDPFWSSTIPWGPNETHGEWVTIPYQIRLESFGLMYGNLGGSGPRLTTTNAIFALYKGANRALYPPGWPNFILNRVAATNPIHLSAVQTYDNIAFTTNPIVNPGNYLMVALYESEATPRSGSDDGPSITYWGPSPYANGMPELVDIDPADLDHYWNGVDRGGHLNYWVNGRRTATALPEPGAFTELGLVGLALFLAFRHKRVESSHRPLAMKP
jgi:hypothetical protein